MSNTPRSDDIIYRLPITLPPKFLAEIAKEIRGIEEDLIDKDKSGLRFFKISKKAIRMLAQARQRACIYWTMVRSANAELASNLNMINEARSKAGCKHGQSLLDKINQLHNLRHDAEKEAASLKGAIELGQENCDAIYADLKEQLAASQEEVSKLKQNAADMAHPDIASVLNYICQTGKTLSAINAVVADKEKEIAKLRADSELLDWLDSQEHRGEIRSMSETVHLSVCVGSYGRSYFAPHIRASIDAAMKGVLT